MIEREMSSCVDDEEGAYGDGDEGLEAVLATSLIRAFFELDGASSQHGSVPKVSIE